MAVRRASDLGLLHRSVIRSSRGCKSHLTEVKDGILMSSDEFEEPETFRVPPCQLVSLENDQDGPSQAVQLWPDEAQTARFSLGEPEVDACLHPSWVGASLTASASAADGDACVRHTTDAMLLESQAVKFDRAGATASAVKRYIACRRSLVSAIDCASPRHAEDHPKLVQHCNGLVKRLKHLRDVLAGEASLLPVEEHLGPLELQMSLLNAAVTSERSWMSATVPPSGARLSSAASSTSTVPGKSAVAVASVVDPVSVVANRDEVAKAGAPWTFDGLEPNSNGNNGPDAAIAITIGDIADRATAGEPRQRAPRRPSSSAVEGRRPASADEVAASPAVTVAPKVRRPVAKAHSTCAGGGNLAAPRRPTVAFASRFAVTGRGV